MSRFAHHNPEDPEGAMEALIDRADHQRKESRSAVDNFVQQLVASGGRAQSSPYVRRLAAKAALQTALAALEGDDARSARLYIEDALLHLREAEG